MPSNHVTQKKKKQTNLSAFNIYNLWMRICKYYILEDIKCQQKQQNPPLAVECFLELKFMIQKVGSYYDKKVFLRS